MSSAPLRLLPLFVLAVALWACDEDNRHFRTDVIDNELTPTSTSFRVNTIITDSGYPRYRIIAPTWLIFDNSDDPRWTFPDGMHMEQYDNFANTVTTVDCDSAVYFTRRDIWRLDGAVDIAASDGQRFLTNQLWWYKLTRTVRSDSFIHIERPDRVIEGFGFESDEKMTRYVVLRPSGIFPASQFTNRQDDDTDSIPPLDPADPDALAQSDPIDAQRTDTAFNGVPTDTVFVSTQPSQHPRRRAARNLINKRRNTPSPARPDSVADSRLN